MTDEGQVCQKCGIPLGVVAAGAQHCPRCAGISEEVAQDFMSEKGFYVELSDAPQKFEHVLGGLHRLPGAVCNGEGCKRPFNRLIALDLRDPKLNFLTSLKRLGAGNLSGHLLPLLYCWPCGGEPTYRVETNGHVTVLGESGAGPQPDFPYPDYPASFPELRATLTPLPPEVQELIRSANDGTLDSDLHFDEENEPHLKPRHQVGGVPYFVQGEHQNQDCPGCGNPMRVLASAAADSGSEKPFSEDPLSQVIFECCIRCRLIHASHQTD